MPYGSACDNKVLILRPIERLVLVLVRLSYPKVP